MGTRSRFLCPICCEDQEVDGSCTLPCEHRFCFDCVQGHFTFVVNERRLVTGGCEGRPKAARAASNTVKVPPAQPKIVLKP